MTCIIFAAFPELILLRALAESFGYYMYLM